MLCGNWRQAGALENPLWSILQPHGASLVFTYNSNKDMAEQLRQSLPSSEKHMTLAMNVSEESSITEGFKKIAHFTDKIDGLVNNAGIVMDSLCLTMKGENWDAVINTNLKGSFLCAQKVAKLMMRQRRGSIVNISSVVGKMGNPGQSNYAAAKAGLEGFTRCMAMELGARNVRVNCVAPGFIATDMLNQVDPERMKSMTEHIALQRLGAGEDVAHAVAFLLSAASSYITGQVLGVNGGLFMN